MALSYTSVERVFDIVPMLGELSSLTSAQVVIFGEHAEAEVNVALARNYTVPVSGNPPMLQALATELCIYRILAQRVFTQERLQDSVWPTVFKDARELLAELAKGSGLLVDSAGTVIGARTDIASPKSNTMDYHSTFSDLPPIDWFHDKDKVDDLEDERDL